MRRPSGGIVEVRRFGGPQDARPTLVLATRSDLDLRAQITAPGATWLDHRLVEREPMPLSMGGFGRETRDALQARAEHLADQGLGRRQAQRIILQRDLLSTLRRRELDGVGEKLSAETGSAACEGHGRRACRGHLSPAPDALLRSFRNDRQRARFPARALVARDRSQARPTHRRDRTRQRRHRMEPGAQARSGALIGVRPSRGLLRRNFSPEKSSEPSSPKTCLPPQGSRERHEPLGRRLGVRVWSRISRA